MRWLPLFLVACKGASSTDEPVAPWPEGVLEPVARANRVSMMLRGVRPTPDEADAVRRDPSLLWPYAARWAQEPAFGATVRDLHADVLWMRVDGRGKWPALGPVAHATEEALSVSRDEAPLHLVEHVVTTGRPYTEVLTADYTLADPWVAAMEGLDYDPDGPEWQVTHYEDGRPEAGLLSNTGLWQRWWTNTSGKHRNRANFVSMAFLCDEIGALDMPVFPDVQPGDPGVGPDALRDDPACAVCHVNLDPLAAHFWGFEINLVGQYVRDAYANDCAGGKGRYCYPIDYWSQDRAHNYRRFDLPPPAYYGTDSRHLQSLGRQIAADPRFATCAVEQAWDYLTQRPDELPTELRDELVDAFVGSGFDYRQLLIDVATSDAAADADAPVLQARPEVYDRFLSDLLGHHWRSPTPTGEVSVLLNSRVGLRDLAGGMDHDHVLAPNHQPNPTALLAWDAAAMVAAEAAVREGQVDGQLVEPAEVADQLLALASRATGRPLSAADPLVVDLQELFDEALAALDDPEAAWTVTVRALLLDPTTVTY